MIVLGIETSCDETAASVVELKNKKKKILSNILYSQFKEHEDYGGVVPEIAFREHVKLVDKIILKALTKAKKNFNQIDVVAATGGPGLHGGLLIGTTIAKSISLSIKKLLGTGNGFQRSRMARWKRSSPRTTEGTTAALLNG